MRLVYKATGVEVKKGDKVTLRGGEECTVSFFRKPHKPSSSGHVVVIENSHQTEYYVGVIGAEWIEREDRT